jgi:hypothetical protein
LQVPETLIGQDVQCPSCGATFVGRVAGGAAPLPSSPRQAPAPPERWDLNQRDDVGRPLHGDRPDDFDDDDFGGRHGRRRRDVLPHRGGVILTFGILSLVICAIFGPIAWIMGNTDLAEMRAGRMDPEGEGMTQAGKICGMLGTALLALAICGFGCGILSSGRNF